MSITSEKELRFRFSPKKKDKQFRDWLCTAHADAAWRVRDLRRQMRELLPLCYEQGERRINPQWQETIQHIVLAEETYRLLADVIYLAERDDARIDLSHPDVRVAWQLFEAEVEP